MQSAFFLILGDEYIKSSYTIIHFHNTIIIKLSIIFFMFCQALNNKKGKTVIVIVLVKI